MAKQKKIKRATYQIIVEIRTGDTLIDATDSMDIVQAYLETWDDNVGATAMKIYTQNEHGAYDLAISKSRESQRKIGFCR
jgi:hypothetical protein